MFLIKGISKNRPNAALHKNQIAGHPLALLNSIVPKIAEPPRIVANMLPVTEINPARFPEM